MKKLDRIGIGVCMIALTLATARCVSGQNVDIPNTHPVVTISRS